MVISNHRCGYGAVDYNSTPENDLLANGFVADGFAAELPAQPTARVYVTQAITDVTDRIVDGLGGMDGKARYEAIDARSKALVAECEAPVACAATSTTPKIGSASWRERECKHVYISVVAVSLKKTKKRISNKQQ